MKYIPYVFKREDAFRFAEYVNIAHFERGENMTLRVCPYCRGRGPGNENSFAINLKTGQFHCLRASCGVSGNLVTLARDFDFSLGNEIDEYLKPDRKQYKHMKTPTKPLVPKPKALAYLESRGISKRTAEKYEITTLTSQPDVIVFPFFDERGQLQSAKYRNTEWVKGSGAKEWFEKDTKRILFGMKQAEDTTKPLVLTEGPLDSLAVYEAGVVNPVSVPNGAKGFTWLPACWNFLHKFPELIIFGDHENGHITLLEELKNRVKIPVKHVREEDYKDCKDANEILQKYGKGAVKTCVERAIPVPVARVIDASEVKRLDIYSIQKLKTGFKLLDRFLYGGLPFGGVTILTAREGNGKSTVASQILVRAIDQGFKCFAYSGELINEIFVSWMGFQVAGPSHVTVRQNKFGDDEYLLSDRNFELISEWYRGKLWLYDINDVDSNDETGSLIKLIEEMIMRYGVQVILIDNLMTALDMEDFSGDDNQKQTHFMKELVKLCIRYKVLAILVAHRRKNAYSEYDTNAEIAGTSNLANLAQIVLSYGRNVDIPEDKRLLKLTKNRLFGKTHPDGWQMGYDFKSRRIYTDDNGETDDVNVEFGWLRKENDFSEDTDEDNPFH